MSIDQSIVYRKFHGSIGERYQDLPSTDIPREWDAVIPDCVNGILAHRDQNPPRNHSLLWVRNGKRDMLLRAMAVQSSISVSRTYYHQKYLLDVTPGQLLDQFDDLLRIGFYSDEAFNRAAVSAFDRPQGYAWSGDGLELNIPTNTLKAVLFGMFFRWYRKRSPVVVAVPENVDYDTYTYAAVKAIYSRLPAGLRCLMGFMTYADPASISNHIALVFVPAQYHYSSAILLDGTTTNIAPLLNNVLPQNAKDMLSELAAMPEEQLKQTLEDMTAFVEMDGSGNFVDLSGLYITNYTDYWSMQARKCENLENPEDFALLKAFAADSRLQTGRLASEYRRIILEDVRLEHLDIHFLNRARAKQDPRDFYREIHPWLPLCVLGRNRSDNLEKYVWDAFWNFCADLAAKQESLEQLEELDKTVCGAITAKITDDGKDPKTVEIVLDDHYKKAYENRVAQLLSERLNFSRELYLGNLEKCQLTLGNSPEKQYNNYRETFLGSLPADLPRDSQAVLDVLSEGKKLYTKLLRRYTKMLKDWFLQNLTAVSDDITQQEYSDLIREITELCRNDYVTHAPETSRDQLLTLAEKRKNELHEKLSNSQAHQQEVTQQLLDSDQVSYFQCLEDLITKREQQSLTTSQLNNIYETLHQKSCPKTLDSYLQAYRAYFLEPFSVADLANRPVAPYLISDFQKLSVSAEPYCLDLGSLDDLYAIRDRVQEHRMISEYLCGKPQMILLWDPLDPVQIQADRLHEMLKGLTDTKPCVHSWSKKEFTDILTFLEKWKYLADSNRYRILRYLKDAPEPWAQELYQQERQKFLSFRIDDGVEQLHTRLEQCMNDRFETGVDIDAPIRLSYFQNEICRSEQIPLNQLYVTLGLYLGKYTDMSEMWTQDKYLTGKAQNALAPYLMNVMTPPQLISTVQAILKIERTSNPLSDRKGSVILAAKTYVSHFFLSSSTEPRDIVDMHFVIIRNDKHNKLQFEKSFKEYWEDHEELKKSYDYFALQIQTKNRQIGPDCDNIPFSEGGTSIFHRLQQKWKAYFGRAGNVGDCTPEVIEAKKQEVMEAIETTETAEVTENAETVLSETTERPHAPEIPQK